MGTGAWVILVLVWLLTVLAALGVGIWKSNYFRKWWLKFMGFDDAMAEFIVKFAKASVDFKWTDIEKKELTAAFAKVIGTITPPKDE